MATDGAFKDLRALIAETPRANNDGNGPSRPHKVNDDEKEQEFRYYPYRYGTSGFRARADFLPSVFVRMGVFTAIRSLSEGGKVCGIVVTASHNAAQDNGIKIIDPSGGMLAGDWEPLATELANKPEREAMDFLLKLKEDQCGSGHDIVVPRILVGRDTRESSDRLSALIIQAAQLFGAAVTDVGQATTPQVHYLVVQANRNEGVSPPMAHYYDAFAGAVRRTAKLIGKGPWEPVTVDCSNGIGGVSASEFVTRIEDVLRIKPVNLPSGNAAVNDNVGAEHVQKLKRLPQGMTVENMKGQRICSLDGDADRLIYHYVRESRHIILDGDKIMSLLATFIIDVARKSGIAVCEDGLNIGICQTAYANGASTNYMRDTLKIEPVFAKTGVKYLHEKALDYDIGLYFESNGHGTVHFNANGLQKLQEHSSRADLDEQQRRHTQVMMELPRLINQSVGDALTDMFTVEAALKFLDWSLDNWDAIYADAPTRLTKVVVADRHIFKVTNAERTCLEPAGIQEAIGKLVADAEAAGNGPARSFVRPSGTEDAVRVYSEAKTQTAADKLNMMVQQVVFDMAGGKGIRPGS